MVKTWNLLLVKDNQHYIVANLCDVLENKKSNIQLLMVYDIR